MLVTTRREVFIKIEMTYAQAGSIAQFLQLIQERHIAEIEKMDSPNSGIREAVHDLRDALILTELDR